MELFRNFHFLFVEKKGFVDTASIIAIRDPDGFTCIDVGGGGEKNIKLTTDLLEENGINISDINTIIISHTHADHKGAIAHFKSINPDINILDHEEDEVMKLTELYKSRYGPPLSGELHRPSNLRRKPSSTSLDALGSSAHGQDARHNPDSKQPEAFFVFF